MISVEEALDKILSYVSVLSTETKPILDTLGQTLAEDISSDIDVPPSDNSAMDGYAVRWEDTQGASEADPIRLRVIDEIPAGYVSDRTVTAGTAIRIMTGAAIPEGADDEADGLVSCLGFSTRFCRLSVPSLRTTMRE